MPQAAELTEKQKECLRLVHQGLTSKEIARTLSTTPGVIDNYINAALTKMGLTNRREAARVFAQEDGALVQRLHLQPGLVAETATDADKDIQIETRVGRLARLVGLPPIGGRKNDLRISQRLLAISRIGFFAALLLIATVVIIQGVITLLV